jgi:hypothetical protein
MFGTGGLGTGSGIFGPFYTGGNVTRGVFNGGPSAGPLFVGGNITGGTYSNIANAYVGGTVGVSGLPAPGMFPKLPSLPAIDAPKLEGYWNMATQQSIDNKMGDSSTDFAEGTPNTPPGTYANPGTYPRTMYGGWTKTTMPHYKYYGPAAGPTQPPGGGTTGVTIDANTASFGSGAEGDTKWDDFAWNKATKTLHVNGTVFIDGPLTIANEGVVMYKGNGTIVANGAIHLNVGGFQPFGGLKTYGGLNHQIFPDETAVGSKQIVGFVSPTEIHITCLNGQTSTTEIGTDENIAGAFYCPAKVEFTGKFVLAGSIITNNMVGPGSTNNIQLRTSPNLREFVPKAMPGRNDGLVGFTKWIRK